MLSRKILELTGWKIKGQFHDETKKAVLIVAPHTSNLDFVIGRLVFNVLGIKVKFLIKKEAFIFPFGFFLKKLGGIPVDRKRKTNIVDQLINEFNESDQLVLIITPEGTRSYVSSWKKGFYYIAKKANVPVVLGFLDYKKKEAGLGPVIWPAGNYDEDSIIIKRFYQNITGRHPEKFNPNAII